MTEAFNIDCMEYMKTLPDDYIELTVTSTPYDNLRKKNGKTYLEPANKNFKNIYPEYDLKIAAVVKGVIRKY